MDTTGIMIAAVGVAGTLAAPVLAGASARKARRDEIRQERDLENSRRHDESKQERLNALRECYTRHNSIARDYHGTLKNWAFKQKQGEILLDQEVLASRSQYRASYAESQMIMSDSVLNSARTVNSLLGDAYGVLKNMQEDGPTPNDTPEIALQRLMDCWNPLREMRSLMRADLGVSD